MFTLIVPPRQLSFSTETHPQQQATTTVDFPREGSNEKLIACVCAFFFTPLHTGRGHPPPPAPPLSPAAFENQKRSIVFSRPTSPHLTLFHLSPPPYPPLPRSCLLLSQVAVKLPPEKKGERDEQGNRRPRQYTASDERRTPKQRNQKRRKKQQPTNGKKITVQRRESAAIGRKHRRQDHRL